MKVVRKIGRLLKRGGMGIVLAAAALIVVFFLDVVLLDDQSHKE